MFKAVRNDFEFVTFFMIVEELTGISHNFPRITRANVKTFFELDKIGPQHYSMTFTTNVSRLLQHGVANSSEGDKNFEQDVDGQSTGRLLSCCCIRLKTSPSSKFDSLAMLCCLLLHLLIQSRTLFR